MARGFNDTHACALWKVIFVVFLQPACIGAFAQNDSCAVITGFKIYNQDLPLDSVLRLTAIELSPQQNSFSISFASHLTQNNRVNYYKLEGADKNWITTGRQATINYTLLPPGRYDFKFRCAEQTEKSLLTIIIKVPFYLSSWFIIFGCTVFIGVAYWLHNLSIKRLLAVEAVRQKVSRDLHDDIGSTLSTINILSTMAKSKLIDDPVKASEYISKISDNSSRMMEAMDDIVWSINPKNDSMQKVFARMREFATEVLEAKDIEVRFHFDEQAYALTLSMEQRRDLFLIFKEAINNIAKYADATIVNIDVRLKEHTLSLTVKDNGVGFNVEKADNGNGLNNMQKRAEKLSARFAILSQQNAGTSVYLEMQIT